MGRRVIASGGPSTPWAARLRGRSRFGVAKARALRDPEGGGYRTTGIVEALARCADIAPRAFPSLSCDPRRAAPVHGEKSGLSL